MSHSHRTAVPPPNDSDALEVYQMRTKIDLLEHPLFSQLQACESPEAILVVLQKQVQGLDRPRSSDDRLTNWLDPTVHILYAIFGTLGGAGLVSLRT